MKDIIQNLTTYTGMNSGSKVSTKACQPTIATQSEMDRLILLSTCFANVSRILRLHLLAEQIADDSAALGAGKEDDALIAEYESDTETGADTETETETETGADANATAVAIAKVSPAPVLPQQAITNKRRGTRKSQSSDTAASSYEKLASYKPPLNVLDYGAFEHLDADSGLFRALVSLNDQQIYYDEHKHLKVRASMQEDNASVCASILFDDPASTAASLERELLPPLIDSELLINGTLSVDFTQGYPVINDSIMWERWDAEPTHAYRWFKQYLKMPGQFGYRNFGEFIRSLSSNDTEIPAVGDSKLGSNRTRVTSVGGSGVMDDDILLDAFAAPQTPIENDLGACALDAPTIARIRCYFHLFYWEDRCLCYDMWEAVALKERRARRGQWLLDDQFTVFDEVFKEVHSRVMNSVGSMDPKDAVKALVDIAKMLRTTVGLPADRPEEGAARAAGVAGSTNVQVINNPAPTPESTGNVGGMVVNFIKVPVASDVLPEDSGTNADDSAEASFRQRQDDVIDALLV